MQDTYLDADATLERMQKMETQADTIKTVLDSSENIMEELKENFSGVSAMKLQNNYNEIAETFSQFRNYLQSKVKEMETLTKNITTTDER